MAASRSSDHRKADSVLPEPVGATTSVSRPEEMASQAPSWAGVGAAKAPVNHARVAGEKRSSADTRTSSPGGTTERPSEGYGLGATRVTTLASSR